MDTTFTITALVGGTVLGFQFVMMLMGMGDDGGGMSGDHDIGIGGDADVSIDGDLSGDASGPDSHTGEHTWSDAADMGHVGTLHWFYELISLRTLSAAMTFFGLTGKTMLVYGYTPLKSLMWATLAGAAAMYAVYWLFKQVFRLQHAGNENIRNAIGQPATVYVPIPGQRNGKGKVTFRLQNRLVEYQAVTEDEAKLATGENVIIVGIVNPGTVRVARESKPAHA